MNGADAPRLIEIGARSRALATAVEPVVGSVYFAPEAHERRGWTPEQLDETERRPQHRGLLDAVGPTSAGFAAREALEAATDHPCASMVEALGDDVVEVVERLQEWGMAIRAANGYYPFSPQEAVLAPGVQQWMRDHKLSPFAGAAP